MMSIDYSAEELVPHSRNMSLLDSIVHCDEESLIAEVAVCEDNIFSTAQGMPATVGIELMAQAIAAFAGVKAKQKGEPVEIGFLVGTRKYESNQPIFPMGSTLRIHVFQELQAENGLGVFRCEICSDTITATANINVFQPDNVQEFLNNELSEH